MMTRANIVAVLGLVMFAAGVGWAVETTPRQRAPVEAFRKTHPCPATGKTTGACPNFVVDHRYPLCAGGADDPSNMTWQARDESLAKDRLEVELCRCLKGGPKR